MKKALLAAVIISMALTSGCGHKGTRSAKKTKKQHSEAVETVTATRPTTRDIFSEYDISSGDDEYDDYDEDYYSDDENDPEYQFRTGYVSAERSMEIEEKKRAVKPDKDGFIIEDGILYDYDGVEPKVVIPDGVNEIAEMAFWSNDTVEALYIPSSVKIIKQAAFWSCSNLKFVQAEEGLEGIAGAAFWSCSGLENVNLPKSLRKTGDSLFWSINGLTVHAPKGSYAERTARSNGLACDNTYYEYTMIDRKNVILGHQYAYGDFTEFTIPENITGIESDAFEYCRELRSIFIPKNVKYIASDAFEYCSGLKEVTIDGCPDIRAEAFEYCDGLETVRINEGSESIGDSTFAYCENLKDVYLPESITSISKRAFEYTHEDLTLHVPEGSYAETYAISMHINFDNNC